KLSSSLSAGTIENGARSEILYLSLSTVKSHIRNIMNKLTVDDRVQAAVAALRSGLV
ncbi:LuxR C-terminal-related transcriptional regulator, partial [Phormidesmis sp. 146-33]